MLEKIGQHGQDTAELFFDGVRVPAANLLGTEEGQGFIQLMQQLPQERLIIAVAAVAAIEEALAHHAARTPRSATAFGKPVFDFQNTKFKLAEVATTAKIARVFLDDCIAKHLARRARRPDRVDGQVVDDRRCSATVADECLQFFGGYGYMTRVPDLADVHRRADPEDLRRHERDHERDHQPVSLTAGPFGPTARFARAGKTVTCSRSARCGRRVLAAGK